MTRRAAAALRALGMAEPITRRDFLNGALVAGSAFLLDPKARLAAGLPDGEAAVDPFTGYGGVGDYATSNGNTYAVMSAGHAMRDGNFETQLAHAIDTGETYDFVSIGGGISGLAAAVFFQ